MLFENKFIKKLIIRIFHGFASFFIIMTLVFILFQMLPGEIYNIEAIKNETVIKNIITKYSLDKPILERYITMLKNTIYFDFGYSYFNDGRTVKNLIREHFSISALLGVIALFIILLISIPLSLLLKEHNIGYKILYPIFIAIISFPTFVIAVVLQFIFCVKLKIFPVLWDGSLSVYILPIISLCLFPIIFITKILSSKMEDIMNSDYVLAARVRGVGNLALELNFILRNSLVVIISYLAPLSVSIVAGSYVVETIFNIPGLGKYFISSITNRDYSLVMGLTEFYSLLLININIICDILIEFLNYRGNINENQNI